MINQVFKSIYDRFSNEDSYEQFAKTHHVFNYIMNPDKQDTIKRLAFIGKQKRLYHAFRTVSSIINDAAIELDVEIAFVKGIFFEKKYCNSNFLRKVGDIDLIVAWEDIYRLLMRCREHGLFCNYTDEQIKDICMKKQLHGPHVCMRTEYVCSGTIYSITIEFHFKFFNKDIHEISISHEDVITSVLKKREYVYVENYKFPILNLKNDMLFVTAHATKHFIMDFLRGVYSDINYYVSLSNFYDVHLMFKMYCNQDDADFNEIITEAKEIGLLEELVLCMYIECLFFEKEMFDMKLLNDLVTKIDPTTRWMAFFTYFIVTKKISNELLEPISTIGKRLLCLANQDNSLDLHTNSTVLCLTDNENTQTKIHISFSNEKRIIVSCDVKELNNRELSIILLQNFDKTGVYKTYTMSNHDTNGQTSKEFTKEVNGDRIIFMSKANVIEDCLYNKEIYLRFSMKDKENLKIMQPKDFTIFTLLCLELS